MVVDNAALMRELIAQHAAEKAKKKENAAKEKSKKRHGSSSRKSRHSSGANSSKHMTPIAEVGE